MLSNHLSILLITHALFYGWYLSLSIHVVIVIGGEKLRRYAYVLSVQERQILTAKVYTEGRNFTVGVGKFTHLRLKGRRANMSPGPEENWSKRARAVFHEPHLYDAV